MYRHVRVVKNFMDLVLRDSVFFFFRRNKIKCATVHIAHVPQLWMRSMHAASLYATCNQFFALLIFCCWFERTNEAYRVLFTFHQHYKSSVTSTECKSRDYLLTFFRNERRRKKKRIFFFSIGDWNQEHDQKCAPLSDKLAEKTAACTWHHVLF